VSTFAKILFLFTIGLFGCEKPKIQSLKTTTKTELTPVRATSNPHTPTTVTNRDVTTPPIVPDKTIPLPTVESVESALNKHFSQYKDRASFEFLERDFAPRIERYLNATEISPKDLVRLVRLRYADKDWISLSLVKGSLQLHGDPARVIAEFVLHSKWSQKPPPNARECGELDESMNFRPGSTVDGDVQVDVAMTIDADGKYVTYDERRVLMPRLRINNRGYPLIAFASMPITPARLLDAGSADSFVPDKTLVFDLGETFTCGLDVNEVDTVRKVQLGGRTVWVLMNWTYNTGHNFVGEDRLLIAEP
jgi:hypothetical protein